jgi:DNA polymerase I-like protein with 3'-5' exonuclease and polymerase domains
MINLQGQELIALDTETTGKYYPRDRAFGISLSLDSGEDFYWDIREEPHIPAMLHQQIILHRPQIACHNASFDYKMCDAVGLSVPLELLHCTVVRACLINEHEGTIFPWTKKRGGYSLDLLGQKYLGLRKSQEFYELAQQFFGRKMTQNQIMERIAELPVELVATYAKQDTRVTLELFKWQELEITEQGIEQIVAFERSVMPELIKAELRGIDVDTDEAERAQPKLTVLVNKAQSELNEIAGFTVNVNSGPQIARMFMPEEKEDENGNVQWYACDGTPLESTGKGAASFGGETLHHMTHPAASKIIEIRSLLRTRDTFLGKHILGHAHNGKVYPNINQTKGDDGGTGTGRLSYTNPAMQQIPARNKHVASIVKPCFLPPKGMLWLETDLASFEVRVFAHLVAAYNDSLVNAYAKSPSLDFHQWVADMTGLVRNAEYSGQPNAKQLNLSMIFNQGRGSTAEKMGMPWQWDSFKDKNGNVIKYKRAGDEANQTIDLYHNRVRGVKTLADRAKAVAETREEIRTRVGRRLRFPRGYKAYKASGLLIQSTSADINKRNWLKVAEALGGDGHLILNTHDSYSMAVAPDWRTAFNRVKEAIEDISDIGLRVPLILDLDGAGDNWWLAKSGQHK